MGEINRDSLDRDYAVLVEEQVELSGKDIEARYLASLNLLIGIRQAQYVLRFRANELIDEIREFEEQYKIEPQKLPSVSEAWQLTGALGVNDKLANQESGSGNNTSG